MKTAAQVKLVKTLRKEFRSGDQIRLSKQFGISKSYVSNVFSRTAPYYRADIAKAALDLIRTRLAEDAEQYSELAALAQRTLEALNDISVPPDTEEELPAQVHQRKVRKYSKRKEGELKQSLQGVLIP
jgi:hypothetical protein